MTDTELQDYLDSSEDTIVEIEKIARNVDLTPDQQEMLESWFRNIQSGAETVVNELRAAAEKNWLTNHGYGMVFESEAEEMPWFEDVEDPYAKTIHDETNGDLVVYLGHHTDCSPWKGFVYDGKNVLNRMELTAYGDSPQEVEGRAIALWNRAITIASKFRPIPTEWNNQQKNPNLNQGE